MNITPKVIEALRTLRDLHASDLEYRQAINVLDNAGVFKAIDEATGYDVSPALVKVSKCTCHNRVGLNPDQHENDCPGDPAEWGDLAYTTTVQCTCPAENLAYGGHLYVCPSYPTQENR